MTDDGELRELFRSARALDEASAPAFHDVVDRARSRKIRTPASLLVRLAVATIVLLLAVLLVPRKAAPPATTSSPADALLSTRRWEAPTDFLLAVPGRDLYQSIPRIGVPMPLELSSPESKKGIRT
jgi:hypothetical protein